MQKVIFNNLCLGVLLFGTYVGFCQQATQRTEEQLQRELSMSETIGKNFKGVYTYFATGEKVPFTGILYAKYPNGNYRSRQTYVNGRGQGKWINYYENGNYKEIGYYNNNLVEGPIRKYHENGTLKAEGRYKDWRIKVGQWKYFNQNGDLVATPDYGEKGSIEEVHAYFDRGEIPYSWYSDILRKNGFKD